MFSKEVSLKTFSKEETLEYKESKKPAMQRTEEGGASTKALKWEYGKKASVTRA